MCKKGWWCLYINTDLEIDVCAGFGCPKKEFYEQVVLVHRPRCILAINKMKLDKESKQILNDLNDIKRSEIL